MTPAERARRPGRRPDSRIPKPLDQDSRSTPKLQTRCTERPPYMKRWQGRQAVAVDHSRYSLSKRGGKATVRQLESRHEQARRAVDADFNEVPSRASSPKQEPASPMVERERMPDADRKALRRRHTWRLSGLVAGWKGNHAIAKTTCVVYATQGHDERPIIERCKRLVATLPLGPYIDGAIVEPARVEINHLVESVEIWVVVDHLSTRIKTLAQIPEDPLLWPWCALFRDDQVEPQAYIKAAFCLSKEQDTPDHHPVPTQVCVPRPTTRLRSWAAPFVLIVDQPVRVTLWRGAGVTKRRVAQIYVDQRFPAVCAGLARDDILEVGKKRFRYRGCGLFKHHFIRPVQTFCWLDVVFDVPAIGQTRPDAPDAQSRLAVFERSSLHLFRRRDALRADITIPLFDRPPCFLWTVHRVTPINEDRSDSWVLRPPSRRQVVDPAVPNTRRRTSPFLVHFSQRKCAHTAIDAWRDIFERAAHQNVAPENGPDSTS